MPLSCLHFLTSDAWGGLELYACTLMAELRDAGCRVLAICKPGSKAKEFLASRGIETAELPSYAVGSLKGMRAVRSLLEARAVDVVHAHYHKDIWYASLALQGDDRRRLFLSIYMGVPKKNDILHRFIYKRVDAIFTSSQELNDRLPGLYPVDPSKIHFLPYGRSLEQYVRSEARRKEIRESFGILPDDVLAGTMIRIDPGKGAMDFARSFPYISPEVRGKIKYLIVGEPTRKGRSRLGASPYEEHCVAYLGELQAFIARENLSDRIFLAGYQSDIVGYLSAFDLFVFPSRDELYSLVVLDAMCMGLPVVAARAGGNLRQVEEGRSGLFYEVADSRDAAEKIASYARSPEMRLRHGRSAREFVERHHAMRSTVASLMTFYRQAR